MFGKRIHPMVIKQDLHRLPRKRRIKYLLFNLLTWSMWLHAAWVFLGESNPFAENFRLDWWFWEDFLLISAYVLLGQICLLAVWLMLGWKKADPEADAAAAAEAGGGADGVFFDGGYDDPPPPR